MTKSADAFRTISEVAADLVLPQHVLRFWETRFPQIRPLKRAGGRRYYRPGDVMLLRTIRQLLYDEGYTIKGVQRLLKEQGARVPRLDAPPADAPTWPDEDAFAVAAPDAVFGVAPEEEAADGAPAIGAGQSTHVDLEALREALACVDECRRILLALGQPLG